MALLALTLVMGWLATRAFRAYQRWQFLNGGLEGDPFTNILRRAAGGSGPSEEVRMGNHVFHVSRGELKHNDETIKLTERERDLLRMFAQRIGSPIPRHELAPEDSTGSDRAIDVQINRLRRKIETDPSNPVYLQTVRGKGYILYSD